MVGRKEHFFNDLVLLSAAQVLQAPKPSKAPCQICTELKSSGEKQQLKMSFSNETALYFS